MMLGMSSMSDSDSQDQQQQQQRVEYEDVDPESSHPPLSPASGAESLFLSGLDNSFISASALASQLRKNQSVSSEYSLTSAGTDDFASAVENADDFLLDQEDDKLIRSSIPEANEEFSDSNQDFNSILRSFDIMAKSKVSKASAPVAPVKIATKPAPVPAAAATPAPADGLDAAGHVYEGAKGVWAWGKGVPLVNIGLGLAEAVAGQVVGVAGTNLEEIDGTIKPQLKNLDSGVLNPAIDAVVGIILGAAGKTEDIVKPIILTFLTPFGLIEEEKRNEETPEVTAK